jgi:hypothetical protein
MTRTMDTDIVYEFDASQFLITIDQGTIEVMGLTSETVDLSQDPVSGFSPTGTIGTLTLAPGETVDFYTRVDATLNLPVSISQSAELGGLPVDLELTATVVAMSSFYVAQSGVPGDFDQDGAVDADDLPLWKTGFGQTSGASPGDGDADGDGVVDGADFLRWQRNFAATPPAAPAAALPEPASGALGGLAFSAAWATIGRRKRCDLLS